mmetsp:Transcript_26264/g.70076  ORF Transcript_26264/g.70076 Transcript_26264/m.70076 type:complete len:210 (-) Transcript_26264:480-1109(-)
MPRRRNNSFAEALSSGFRCKQSCNIFFISLLTFRRRTDGAGIIAKCWRYMAGWALSPSSSRIGFDPLSISNSVMPADQTSTLQSPRPNCTSGAMYIGVPTTSPTLSSSWHPLTNRLTPKSQRYAKPCLFKMMLSGFTSRCTKLTSCSLASVRSRSTEITFTISSGNFWPVKALPKVTPSMYSITIIKTGSGLPPTSEPSAASKNLGTWP